MSGLLLRGLDHSKVALVTGAAQGIGWQTVKTFQNAGMCVAAVDIKSIPKLQADDNGGSKGGKILRLQADITNTKDISNVFRSIKKEFDRTPRVLVNCAGITRDATILNMSSDKFDEVMNVNLRAPWLLCQQFADGIINSAKTYEQISQKSEGQSRFEEKIEGGSIINISSIVGKTGNFGQTNYAASKHGLIGLTKSLAKELGRYNIRCNAILPGFIETPMAMAVPEKVLDKFRNRIPLNGGIFGHPQNIADAIAFLASNNAEYITGAVLEVTGGLDM